MSRAKRWCFTLNNYTTQDVDRIKALVPTVAEYVTYGYEVAPSTGTPHLQGFIIFKEQLRLVSAKTHIGDAHMSIARGSNQQCADYCQKDQVFEEEGEIPNPPVNGQSVNHFKEWVVKYYEDHEEIPSEKDYATEFPGLFLRYRSNLASLVQFLCPNAVLEDGALREWQATCYNQLIMPADDRSIFFYVDPQGGSGKTWFQRFMLTRRPEEAQVLSVGKRDDIAHAIQTKKKIFMFNVARGGMEFLHYPVLEQLKDKMVFSPIYNSQTKIFRTNVHVAVLSNEMPNLEAITRDRYVIVNLS